jgi:hypothetical protein
MGFWTHPADAYETIDGFREQLEADAEELASLNARRRQLFQDSTAVLDHLDTRMTTLVPEGCLVYTESVAGSESRLLRWSVDYAYPSQQPLAVPRLPLTAIQVLPEYVASELDVPAALAAMRNRLSVLQPEYDLRQLQRALLRVTELLVTKLQPFDVPSPGSHASAMMGKIDGIPNYLIPLENTDLYRYTQAFRSVWLACQTRLELLQCHPTLVDASPFTRFGSHLTQYEVMLDADRDERSRAPAQAEGLKGSHQQALDRWTPILLEMTPEYYEDALGGLGSMMANAQAGLTRARASSTPTYALLVDYYRDYVPKVSSLLQQAQTEYTRIIPWYFKTMPDLVTSTPPSVRLGQDLSFDLQANEPGGSFSALCLPAGLTIDPATGRVSGRPIQAGSLNAVVRYTSPSGVSACRTIPIEIRPPQAATQVIAVRSGFPELQLSGVPGLSCLLQAREAIGKAHRWSTLRTVTVGSDETWTDNQGLAAQRFYRLVWIPSP